jgi:hypothetical protein
LNAGLVRVIGGFSSFSIVVVVSLPQEDSKIAAITADFRRTSRLESSNPCGLIHHLHCRQTYHGVKRQRQRSEVSGRLGVGGQRTEKVS